MSVSICMYVCVHAYMYECRQTCIYLFMHIQTHVTDTCVWMHACMCMYLCYMNRCICILVNIHECMYMYAFTHNCMFACLHVYIHAWTYFIYVCMH